MIESNLDIIEEIIKDSVFLSKLIENIEEELVDFIYNFPNINNLNNIIKLYKKDYNFTDEELIILLEDLNFIKSSRLYGIFIIIKFKYLVFFKKAKIY